ncbi:MAG TPA: acyl-CoA dehydrogenase family protein [Acidimicrobiales bacterium]|nr:acyl-CoA dehydrogenase family protein [Acidimicrobiales bacterium]
MEVTHDDVAVREAVQKLLYAIDGLSPREAWGAAFDAGLSRVDFPVGLGGLGARPELQWLVDDALRAAGVPSGFPQNISGQAVVAPVIAAFGTADQQVRHLRAIYTCDEIWCQLFSEPDAGSDLAALQMRAVRDGDGWRITGQKVWNTMAHVADFGLLLARTSDAPRHKGITCFLLDMRTPGVEVRGIRQMTGDAEFNEVILDGAFVPDSARVGEVNEGWAVALGTLMAERFGVNQVLDNETPFIDEVVALWRSLAPERRDGATRQRLARLVIRSRLLDLMRARVEADARDGVHGPEGSIMKLLQSELTPDIFELGLDLLGADGMLFGTYDVARPTSWSEAGAKAGDLPVAFLRSRAYPIEGGSVEIQRNTIGERILGLPRDR